MGIVFSMGGYGRGGVNVGVFGHGGPSSLGFTDLDMDMETLDIDTFGNIWKHWETKNGIQEGIWEKIGRKQGKKG